MHQLSGWFVGRSILKIETIHHKALIKVVFDNDVGYDECLQMTNEVSLPQKYILALICEVL